MPVALSRDERDIVESGVDVVLLLSNDELGVFIPGVCFLVRMLAGEERAAVRMEVTSRSC